MTAPTTETEPSVASPLGALRAVRQTRTTNRRKPTARKATPRKATTTSRADGAAKRGKYADRIVGAIKTGCAVLSTRAPVQAAILMERAQPIAEAIERVAEEDKRVDAFIQKISSFFGKSTAWGELGGEVAVTGAALALSVGAVPAGPVGLAMAFIAGEALEAGLWSASRREAEKSLRAQGVDPSADAYPDTMRWATQQHYDHFKASLPQPGQKPPPADDDQGPPCGYCGEHHPGEDRHGDETQVIADPEPAWAG
jgi:hypothetical protein